MSADDHLNPRQFFHGTKREITGDTIEPGHEPNFDISIPGKVYMSGTRAKARKYAGSSGRVFRVEPTGPYEHDDNLPSNHASFQSDHPLRIVGEVKQRQTGPSLEEAIEQVRRMNNGRNTQQD